MNVIFVLIHKISIQLYIFYNFKIILGLIQLFIQIWMYFLVLIVFFIMIIYLFKPKKFCKIQAIKKI